MSFKGKKHSEKTKEKMSLIRKGIRFSKQHLVNLSESHKGKSPSEETRLKMSDARRGEKHPLFGKPRSEETKKRLAFANTGKRASEETILKMKSITRDERFKAMVSKTSRERWADPTYAKRVMKKIHAKPNITESRIEFLLESLFAGEWKYVGNGEVWIGGKNPDFININGQKKIIEFFGHYWHNPGDEETRKAHFKQYGFDTLVVWGNDLKNLECLKAKLRSFHECSA